MKLSLIPSSLASLLLTFVLVAPAVSEEKAKETASKQVPAPRRYTRTLRVDPASDPTYAVPEKQEEPEERKRGPRIETLEETLKRSSSSSKFSSPAFNPATLRQPPPEPTKRKNWILPPVSKDLKDNKYSFRGSGEEEVDRSWGWLDQSIQERKAGREEALDSLMDNADSYFDNPMDLLSNSLEESQSDQSQGNSRLSNPLNSTGLRLDPEESLLRLDAVELNATDQSIAHDLDQTMLGRRDSQPNDHPRKTQLQDQQENRAARYQPRIPGDTATTALEAMKSEPTRNSVSRTPNNPASNYSSLNKLNARIRSEKIPRNSMNLTPGETSPSTGRLQARSFTVRTPGDSLAAVPGNSTFTTAPQTLSRFTFKPVQNLSPSSDRRPGALSGGLSSVNIGRGNLMQPLSRTSPILSTTPSSRTRLQPSTLGKPVNTDSPLLKSWNR